ncbi:Nucleotidylyl transferase [Trametes punicea]|nr:Nucleotidylyl transferase [Trametes punicea]
MPALPATLPDVRHTLLLTTVHSLHDTPNFLASPVSTAARKTTDSLRIVILSPFFNPPQDPREGGAPHAHGAGTADTSSSSSSSSPGISRTANWDDVQRLLTFVYVQATKVAQDMGNILLDIDVLLRGTAEPFPEQVVRQAERIFSVLPHNTALPVLPASLQERHEEIIALEPDDHPLHTSPRSPPPPPADPSLPPLYPVVALGGTFDHLHAGHKILLGMGAWIASEKLIVGITDDALLGKKAFKEAMEPLAVRTARTRAFLELFRPGIVHDLVPIDDVCGPAGWDPYIHALVVSKETLPGASTVHKRREEQGLPPLRTFVIDVISATEASVDAEDAALLKTAKMSSTYIRQWIVQSQPQQHEHQRRNRNRAPVASAS